MKECIFCKEGNDFSYAKSFLGDWPYENRVVYFDENVYAIVGYGPQVIPYILIITYRHINSTLEMNMYEKKSVYTCLEFLSNRGGYGENLCVFEHGGRASESSSSLDHCHLHVVDGSIDLYNQDFPCDEIYNGDFLEFETEVPPNSYLLIGSYYNHKMKIRLLKDVLNEHQYLRKKLANLIKSSDWDWKKNMNYEKMIKIYQNIKISQDK